MKLTERTRTLLTLELAIVLPATALMAFSIWNLKHIQRDKAIEAAIQRDFSYVLKIAEKKVGKKPTISSPLSAKSSQILTTVPKLKASSKDCSGSIQNSHTRFYTTRKITCW